MQKLSKNQYFKKIKRMTDPEILKYLPAVESHCYYKVLHNQLYDIGYTIGLKTSKYERFIWNDNPFIMLKDPINKLIYDVVELIYVQTLITKNIVPAVDGQVYKEYYSKFDVDLKATLANPELPSIVNDLILFELITPVNIYSDFSALPIAIRQANLTDKFFEMYHCTTIGFIQSALYTIGHERYNSNNGVQS